MKRLPTMRMNYNKISNNVFVGTLAGRPCSSLEHRTERLDSRKYFLPKKKTVKDQYPANLASEGPLPFQNIQ